jgi:hypothetical protein
MMYWAQFTEDRRWMPGTVLAVPSNVPSVSHFVMVEFINFLTGVEWAIHSMPGIGVARVPLDAIIARKPVTVRSTPHTPEEAEQIVLQMQRLIGHPYDLIEANCEHVTRFAATGQWKSEQVSAVQIGLLVAGAVAIARVIGRRR